MGSMEKPKTWLDLLRSQLKIDIDSMDPNEAKRWLPFRPCDQTSNQRLVYEQMVAPENRGWFLDTVKECKLHGWEYILVRVSAILCARNIDNIDGRVLLQTSPYYAYDTEKIVAQARAYVSELERVGMSRDRVCIKIPCTGAALNASLVLLDEGIRTLGTSLFSLPQAVAASQAGCLSISPYYNFPWYHSDNASWPNMKDPALEHPMSSRIVQILQYYDQLREKTGKEQPLLKPASFKSAREVMAMGELGCHHATIPGDIIQQLSVLQVKQDPPPGFGHTPYPGIVAQRLSHLSSTDPLGAANLTQISSSEVDYLANNGEALTEAIDEDPVTKRGLHEALEEFKVNELQSRVAIEEAVRQLDESMFIGNKSRSMDE